jgi:uncharacterized protein (UPF0335 family)
MRKSNTAKLETGPGPGHNSIDTARLRELVSRIEAVEEERASLAEDVRGLFAEAKSAGFDVRAIRTIIRIRKQDQAERQEREALVAEYMEALGGLADLPLGKAALERAGLAPPV